MRFVYMGIANGVWHRLTPSRSAVCAATFITLGIPTSTLVKLREPELRDLATDSELLVEIHHDEAAAKAEATAAFEAEQARRITAKLVAAQALRKADESARQRAVETPEERGKREDAEEVKAAERREKAAAKRKVVAREREAAYERFAVKRFGVERFEAERRRDEVARAVREEKLRTRKAAMGASGGPRCVGSGGVQ